MAMADGGTLLHAPDVYMQKIRGWARVTKKAYVELDASPADNVRRLAKAKGVDPAAITVLVLRSPRATPTSLPAVLLYWRGSAPSSPMVTSAGRESIAPIPTIPASICISAPAARPRACWRRWRCAASAARCKCRLILDTDEKRERAGKMGVH